MSTTTRKDGLQFIDLDKVGVNLDVVGLRLEKTKDPSTKSSTYAQGRAVHRGARRRARPRRAGAPVEPDRRRPEPKLKAAELKLPVPRQHIDVYLLPSDQSNAHARITLLDADISDPRVRTEKGVDGYALLLRHHRAGRARGTRTRRQLVYAAAVPDLPPGAADARARGQRDRASAAASGEAERGRGERV